MKAHVDMAGVAGAGTCVEVRTIRDERLRKKLSILRDRRAETLWRVLSGSVLVAGLIAGCGRSATWRHVRVGPIIPPLLPFRPTSRIYQTPKRIGAPEMKVAIAKQPLFAKCRVAHPKSWGEVVSTTQASKALSSLGLSLLASLDCRDWATERHSRLKHGDD
jgi:hypothetical protein